MQPLSNGTPKPLLEVNGKTILEHKFERLPDTIEEIILVIGHHGKKIREYLGSSYKSKKISYVIQKKLNGTAGAVLVARDLLKERFLVMMGDDLYTKEDTIQCLEHDWSLLTYQKKVPVVNNTTIHEMSTNENGNLTNISIKKAAGSFNCNAGLYVLHRDLFRYEPVPLPGIPDELSLPHTLVRVAKDFPIKVTTAQAWLQITTPNDMEKVAAWLNEH